MTVDGALRFARFAVPPNALGYCGPAGTTELAAYRSGELTYDAGLVELAHAFEGAWPYLELLAGAIRSDDPLDDRVVEAYWIGNELCGRVETNDWAWHLVDRFGPRAGNELDRVTAGVEAGGLPHHAFHVFCVYPWVGLLREGRGGREPLDIVRQCHVSWGSVVDRIDDVALIDGPTLTWDRTGLARGPSERRSVHVDRRLSAVDAAVTPGAVVAVHWGEVVDVLDGRQQIWLERVTRDQIAVANLAGAPLLG